jgi:hypothetical protein
VYGSSLEAYFDEEYFFGVILADFGRFLSDYAFFRQFLDDLGCFCPIVGDFFCIF